MDDDDDDGLIWIDDHDDDRDDCVLWWKSLIYGFVPLSFFFLFLSGSLYIIHALLLTLNLMIYLVKVYAYYILNLLGQTKCPWHVGCSTLKTEFNKSKEY